jgi:hypothetical protein
MLNKKTLFYKVLLGCLFVSAIAITACNDEAKPANAEGDKKIETPAAVNADTATKPPMDTASIRPTKPGP